MKVLMLVGSGDHFQHVTTTILESLKIRVDMVVGGLHPLNATILLTLKCEPQVVFIAYNLVLRGCSSGPELARFLRERGVMCPIFCTIPEQEDEGKLSEECSKVGISYVLERHIPLKIWELVHDLKK